jgi:hypothetical protein
MFVSVCCNFPRPLLMLTGSVVGDGNYEALNSLFAAAAGHTLKFEGSLAQEGSPPVAVVYTIKSPMLRPPAVSAGMDAVSEARASLGWVTELLDCCECSCSIADYGLQAEPMVGAIDVGKGGLLRVLMLSSSRPELGRVVCLLDPRRSPPSLEGGDEEAFLAGGAPRIRTELVPTQIAPPPRAQDSGAAASAATAAERTDAPLDMAPVVASVPAAEQQAAAAAPGDKKARLAHLAAPPKLAPTAEAPAGPLLAVFSGHLHHPMFGELEASLSLSEKLDAEPPQAAAGRSATRAKWPPPPAEDSEGLPAPSTSWWRGVWRVTEFKVCDEVFVGVHGSAGAPIAAMLLVTPSRSGPPCDLAQFERDIADASRGRIQGGDDAWAAGMRPEYTLTQRSGGGARALF